MPPSFELLGTSKGGYKCAVCGFIFEFKAGGANACPNDGGYGVHISDDQITEAQGWDTNLNQRVKTIESKLKSQDEEISRLKAQASVNNDAIRNNVDAITNHEGRILRLQDNTASIQNELTDLKLQILDDKSPLPPKISRAVRRAVRAELDRARRNLGLSGGSGSRRNRTNGDDGDNGRIPAN